MKIAISFCVVVLLILGIVQNGLGWKDEEGWRKFELRRMQINKVDCPITNYGAFGQSEANSAGCYWPKGSGLPYIFGAGIWIGAIVNGDTLVSAGYNTVGRGQDFCPGPPEHGQDHYQNEQSHPEDRLYFSTDPTDFEEWPLRDSLGNRISAVFGTTDKWAHQEVWCEYHDMVEEYHSWASGTYPIGLAVRQIAFAWNAPINENIIFILYEFENISGDTIKDMYVGHAADDDVGWADNDLLGCDIERSLGYCYTLVYEDGWPLDIATPPYYVGKRFLQGPKADDTVYVAIGDPNDPGYPDAHMDTVYPGEHLPLTAFTRCTRGYDADEEWERYSMLAGYNIETRDYDPWQGVIDIVPDDKRMVMGCGPFELAPGEVDTCLIAVMFSSENVGGLNYLKEQGDIAEIMYKNNWAFPSPPLPPKLTAIPGDQKVILSWDNSPELKADEFAKVMKDAGDLLYRDYDFEGYRLWKSRTALPGDWELLGEWDIENEIKLLPGDMYIPGIGIVGSGEESNNSGLWYSYVDEDVINGITYYYAVTAFDYNTPGDPAKPNQDLWVSLESSMWEVAVTPRSEPGNLIAAEGTTPIQDKGTTNVLTLQEPKVISSIAVTGDTYRMVWDAISLGKDGLPYYSYKIWHGKGFIRGDIDGNGIVDINDFDLCEAGGPFSCDDAADVNDDGTVDSLDCEYLSNYLNFGGPPPPAPFPDYGLDPTPDELTCGDQNWGIGSPVKVLTELKTEIEVDTITGDTVETELWEAEFVTPIFDGIQLEGEISMYEDSLLVLPDSVRVTSGEYADEADLRIAEFFTPQGAELNFTTDEMKGWAYRGGGEIEIHWVKSNDTLRAEVWYLGDTLNPVEIPVDTTIGNGWCFGPHLPFQSPKSFLTQNNLAIWFYISGVRYYFNGGSRMTAAGFASIDSGDVWTIYSSAPHRVPCAGNEFIFGTERFQYAKESKLDLIRVVPNPYIVRADWDLSRDYRKIQFVNLPSKCTIRIYNLAGDLIKIIEHTPTSPGAEYEGNLGGTEEWDLLTRNDQLPASGIYIYHISTEDGQEKIGKFAIIR